MANRVTHIPQLIITVDPDGTSPQTYKTWDTWHMIPSQPLVIAAPEVKTSYVDIPGYSKRYDYTEALQGSVPYGARTGQWQLYLPHPSRDPIELISDRRTLESLIHGKYVSVCVDESQILGSGTIAAYVYHGRLTLDEWMPSTYPDPRRVDITIGYTLDPDHTTQEMTV